MKITDNIDTYIAAQIKCCAESMCSIILSDSLALQCGFRHLLTVVMGAECGQHGNALLITNATSLIGCCKMRFLCRTYQRCNKSVDKRKTAV